jgi:shikimate kinase
MLAKLGDYAFLEAEGHATKQISKTDTIISLTGSNPLNAEAMRHLKQDGYVVYLDSSPESIKDRCEKMCMDRLVGQANYTLEEILKFRRGVYDNWFDSRIMVEDSMTQEEIADEIIRELKFGSHVDKKAEKIQNPNSRESTISNVQVKEYRDMHRINEY